MFAILSADGRLELHSAHHRENLLTGETIVETTGSQLPWRQPETKGLPDFLLLSDQGDHVFAAWQDGTLLNFDTRDFDHPKLGEQIDLVPEAGQRLTALQFLLGKGTLLAGDSLGRVQAWFGVHAPKKESTSRSDWSRLTLSPDLPAGKNRRKSAAWLLRAIRGCSPSATAIVACGSITRPTSDWFSTRRAPQDAARPVGAGAARQRTAGTWGRTSSSIGRSTPAIPKRVCGLCSCRSGTKGPPGHRWFGNRDRASTGSEPKLSLIPLVFGTLKATFYSLLFGVPLALGAALYTSEFMRPSPAGQDQAGGGNDGQPAERGPRFSGRCAGCAVCRRKHPDHRLHVLHRAAGAGSGGAYLWQLLPQRLTLAAARWRLAMIF